MTARNDIPDWFNLELDQRNNNLLDQFKGTLVEVLNGIFERHKEGFHHNCFYCGHFNRENDTCRLAPQSGRPPTFIIVHGCSKWWHEDDIPY